MRVCTGLEGLLNSMKQEVEDLKAGSANIGVVSNALKVILYYNI